LTSGRTMAGTSTSFVSSVNNAELVPLNFLSNPYPPPKVFFNPARRHSRACTLLGQSFSYGAIPIARSPPRPSVLGSNPAATALADAVQREALRG